jgi:hypothetical protein
LSFGDEGREKARNNIFKRLSLRTVNDKELRKES